MKVSIIVAIYKVEKYLPQCIESIIHQTFRDIEVILVDDGSPDNSGAICDEYAKKDERIHVIHQENAGAAVARNNGILAATSEYVMFADPDDWFELDCVEKAITEIEKQQVDLCFFQRCVEYDDHTENYPKKASRKIDREELTHLQYTIIKGADKYELDFTPSPPWCKIIRRAIIVENKVQFPVGQKRGQDLVFSLYLMEKVQSAYFLDYVGYHYRVNSDAISNRYNPKMADNILRLLEEVKKFVDAYRPNDEAFHRALGMGAYATISTLEGTYFFHKDCRLSKKEVITELKNFMDQDIVKYDMSYCKMCDFKSMKKKIKYFLVRNHWFGLYYALQSRKK